MLISGLQGVGHGVIRPHGSHAVVLIYPLNVHRLLGIALLHHSPSPPAPSHQVKVLDDVSLTVEPGEVVALVRQAWVQARGE